MPKFSENFLKFAFYSAIAAGNAGSLAGLFWLDQWRYKQVAKNAGANQKVVTVTKPFSFTHSLFNCDYKVVEKKHRILRDDYTSEEMIAAVQQLQPSTDPYFNCSPPVIGG